MRIRALRPVAQADLSNEVVHFTGRQGPANDQTPGEIRELDGPGRLRAIVNGRTLEAFRPFHGWGDPVVCFTEATEAGLRRLVEQNRYHPWGIGFSKDWIFQRGGGPAFYVRGDQWDELCEALADHPQLLAFGTKYWPGVDVEDDETEEQLGRTLVRQNEWAHEREWRVPRPEQETALHFEYRDVATLVVPEMQFAEWLNNEAGGGLENARVIVLPSPAMRWVLQR